VLTGEVAIDRGEIVLQKGVRITHLPQEVPVDLKGSVFDIVLLGLGKKARLISDYHHISHQLHTDHTPELMRKLDSLQEQLDREDGWAIHNEVETVIAHMKLDAQAEFEQLSGGQKRRVLLARALVSKPDVLLLDEPTNHLDIDTIQWLEGFLKEYPGTLFFVTHDRAFMSNLSTKIVELDRGKIYSWTCDYRTFLERKEAMLENEAVYWENFDKKLAQEEVWIRKGVKARRVRNEGRVKALQRLREEKKAQRRQMGQVRMQAQASEQSGHLVIKASNIGFQYGEQCLIDNFSTQIMRGDKIGVIGPNGSGKTTLLRILLGKLAPQKGKVRLGTNLEVAYYDQLREQLDEDRTVAENVCGSGDTVVINGKPRHIIGYLQEFLFPPERSRTPVKVLSGGERNRLFLARLFTKPSNFLIMDEPTNDLDVETLELLEELLVEYSGTLILVSHDRAFLNNVVTSTMVLEGQGIINEYPGGYDDWLAQTHAATPVAASKDTAGQQILTTDAEQVKPRDKKKLSYNEERELEKLVVTIEQLESQREELYATLAEPGFYQKEPKEIAYIKAQLESLEDTLLQSFERWEYLENLKSA
ncbi:MAG: ATP-binding cassette domain-containing protein, partial [Candidatus Omnitrophica bacterium]|nr:ATP-binding cassette domain-containing protein [Candidatus Omnitrophota bacterium]